MKLSFWRPGISRFVFAALLLAFNWPVMSIPAPQALFGWLFAAWGLGIALLFLTARSATNWESGSAGQSGPGPNASGPNASGPNASGPNASELNAPEPEGPGKNVARADLRGGGV